MDLWAEDQGEWSQGWGEFGQWPWNRDLREVGHCVSGSRLRNPASRRGPGTAPEILPLPGEAVSAQGHMGESPGLSESPSHGGADLLGSLSSSLTKLISRIPLRP